MECCLNYKSYNAGFCKILTHPRWYVVPLVDHSSPLALLGPVGRQRKNVASPLDSLFLFLRVHFAGAAQSIQQLCLPTHRDSTF